MKWLKDIFSGKKDDKKTTGLALSEINSWLEERSHSSDFEEKLESTYKSVGEVARSLAGSIKALEAAEPDSSAPPKLLRAGLAARGEIVKQMESLAEKLKPPRGRDIDSASEHHWALVKGLERTVTTFGRAQRFTAALFPKEIEAVNRELTRISRLLVELEGEIKQRRGELEETWYSRELVDKLRKDLSDIADLRERAKSEESRQTELSASFAGMEEEQKRHAAGKDGKKIEELKKSLEEKHDELRKVKDEIADLVTPLNKALGRIMKQGSSDRLVLQHGNVFEQLRTMPSQVADSDIAGSLEELKVHLATLGLKDRKKEKTLDHIDLLIKNKSLQKIRVRQAELEKAVQEEEALLSEISSGPLQLKGQLSQTRKDLKSLEASLQKTREELSLREDLAGQHQAELKERLGKLAEAPVEIDLDR
ncbi:MAG: hypothetical protein EHM14_04365 [Methanothrix sp.]|nr:MAG: hypothetical protein EHM14_04365 [Methanothrix sp.]